MDKKLCDLQTRTNALKEGIGTRFERDPAANIRSQQMVIIGGGATFNPTETLNRFYSLGQHMKSIEDSLDYFSDNYVVVPQKDIPAGLISHIQHALDCTRTDDKSAQAEKAVFMEKYEGPLPDEDWNVCSVVLNVQRRKMDRLGRTDITKSAKRYGKPLKRLRIR